jgi:hypothetical protein
MVRLGGLVLVLMGAAIFLAGGFLALALFGAPLPAWPGVDQVAPFFAQIAAASVPPIPPGAPVGALLTVGWGQAAAGVMAGGALIAILGLAQLLSGQRSVVALVLIAGLIIGGAVAAVLAN